MIIAYYPGSGGNRYLQKLLGNSWAELNKSYDAKNLEQQYKYRYLLTNEPALVTQHVLTHCMNSSHIEKLLLAQPLVFIKSDLKASLRREWILHGHQRYMNKCIKHTVSRLDHYNAFKDVSWPEITDESEIDMLPTNILQELRRDYSQVTNSTYNVNGKLTALTQNLIDKINSAYEIINWHNSYYQQYPEDMSAAEQIIDVNNDNSEFTKLMQQELNLYQSELFDQVWDSVNG